MSVSDCPIVVALMAASAIACSQDASTTTPDASAPDAAVDASPDGFLGILKSPDPCPPTPCGPTELVTSANDILALINNGRTWPTVGRVSSGCVAPTVEIEVKGSFTVDIASVAFVPHCNDRCRDEAEFLIRDSLARCTATVEGTTQCRTIAVEDTRFRLLIYNTFQGFPLQPTIELIPPCDEVQCAENERLCEATHVCWLDVGVMAVYDSYTREHCRFCLGLPHQQCECWDGEQAMPDGTSCRSWNSVDTGGWGRCVDGLCWR
jgi:hypothetical protein